jgi:hypothetical protein
MLNLRRKRHVFLGLVVTMLATLEVLSFLPSRRGALPAVPTGAAFSVTVGRFVDHRQARIVAANLEAAGLPAFTRSLSKGAVRQVVVGPYVTTDEAESAQRLLRRRGFSSARLLVDESIRRISTAAVGTAYNVAPPDDTALVVVSSGGRVSVVLELPSHPRRMQTMRTQGNVVEIEAGPITDDGRSSASGSAEWRAPAGVDLFDHVAVDEEAGVDGRTVRVRLTTPALVQHHVRSAGRRVYVDLWAPQSVNDVPLPPQMQPEQPVRAAIDRDEHGEDAEPVPAANPAQEYAEALRPAVTRFTEIEPFLLSAATAPSPEVLVAISRTVGGVAEWVKAIQPPAGKAAEHGVLVAAVDMALSAVSQDFTGDRGAQARNAIARAHAAAAALE